MTMLHEDMSIAAATTTTVAAHVREARRRLRHALDAGDACGWAVAMIPQSVAAQCLMLDWLLSSEQNAAAATLSHTLLHAEGANWRLWYRRSRALLALDRLDEAEHAIDRVLGDRPSHRGALLIKAELASRTGRNAAALHVLESADRLHPRHPDIAAKLMSALLEAGRVHDAQSIIDEMPDPPMLTRVAVLIARNRLLDAQLLLHDALDHDSDPAHRSQIESMLIDVHERAGNWPALRAMSDRVTPLHPRNAARLAEAMLAMGDLDASQQLIEANGPTTQRQAHVTAAIASMKGSHERHHAYRSPRMTDDEFTVAGRAAPWLRSLMGLIVAEQIDVQHARRAGADPSHNVIDMLLRESITTLEAAIDRDPHGAHVSEWQDMIDSALTTLSLADDAQDAEHATASDHTICRVDHRIAA